MHCSESKDPFSTDLAFHYRRPFRLDKVREAAKYIVGTHDFSSFCADCSNVSTPIRTIYSFDIENSGDSVIMLVKGNGFLYNMIRIIVGTLIDISEGRFAPDDMPAILEAKNRLAAGRTAMAHGLYLNRVFYSEEELSELEEKIGVRRAFNKGMDLISRRSHSKKELVEKISKTNEKKYAIIACDLLEERGYISDEAFAEQYFDYLKRVKHFGKNRIQLELSKKGIDKLIIQNLFESDYSEPQEEIKSLLETKFLGKLNDEKSKKRTFNSLLRMGYNYSEIRKAIDELN